MRNRHALVVAAAGLAIALTGAIPSPAVAQGIPLQESDAAHTSLVLVPGVGLELGSTGKGFNMFFGLGGHVDWLPRIPVVVTAGGYTEIAGKSGWSSYEVGGGYRFSESLRSGVESAVVGGEMIAHGDSMLTTYLVGRTAVRHYNVLRAGLLHNQSVNLLGTANVTTSSFYVGLSRNELVSMQGGLMGNHVVRTTSLDVLFGSPPASAPKSNKIGGRLSTNIDYSNNFDTRFEFGLRPGLGAYIQMSINVFFMLKDIAR